MIKPKVVVLFSSYRCNSRCVMCYAWKKQRSSPELSVEQIDRIFNDRILASSVEIINLTGGEPTLRPDLVELVKTLANRCRNLRRIDIPTNGINTEQVLDKLESVLTVLLPTNVRIAVTVSLDGIGEVHEKVRGVAGIFKNIENTIKGIREMQSLWPDFCFGINATISKLNFDRLEEIRTYALASGIGINFTLGAISEIGVESAEMKDGFLIGDKEKNRLVEFFEKHTEDKTIEKKYGELVIGLLKTGRRQPACAFMAKKAVLIEPDGNTYLCGNFKDFFIGNALRDSFDIMAKNAENIPRDKWKRCFSCESNCYVEEMF